MNLPAIYIVTPCLNIASTIEETIKSVVFQTTDDFLLHYHIQDGGSTDGTLEVLDKWRTIIKDNSFFHPNCKFSFSSEKDASLYEAINRAFMQWQMEDTAFIGWINGDDILWPGTLGALGALTSQLPEVEWVTGYRTDIDANSRVIFTDLGQMIFPRELISNGLIDSYHNKCIQQESTFWHASLWKKVDGLSSFLKYCGDWDLWRRFSKHATLYQAQRQFGAFRHRNQQKSGNLKDYQTEIDLIVPFTVRHKTWNEYLNNTDILLSMPTVFQDADGIWKKGRKKSITFQNLVAYNTEEKF